MFIYINALLYLSMNMLNCSVDKGRKHVAGKQAGDKTL